MILSMAEMEESFSLLGQSELFNGWKHNIISTGLCLEIDGEVLNQCIQQFEFHPNQFHQFFYLYHVLSQSEFRKKWPRPEWF